MGRYVEAVVSKQALLHNLKQIRTLAPAKIIAMVKANAYGHGLRNVTKILQHDVDAFGVASIEEALIIRAQGITTDIVLMEGIFRPDELMFVQQYNLTLVVHHALQVEALKNFNKQLSKKFKIWIKINTGMNRLGFQEREFESIYAALMTLSNIEIIGFMTHFAQADAIDNIATAQQMQHFERVVGDRVGERSLANSAGICAWPKAHANWVRPGLILYGASPFADTVGNDHNLLPAMTLRSEIIAIQEIKQGEKVGYGATWESSKSVSKIGIVAIGYGDGYPWHAKSGTPVLVNNQRTLTAGRVSMDMLALDITELDGVKVGDPVTLWGEGLPIEEVARHAGTIAYELFCRFTERVTVHVVS